ncbi:CCA tRNA nucleotidyltransferase [Rhodovulum sp. DZ06]|uniref:CCA tRNA nucleotidyltransferase n=1 Tax=Rhodovulum sp. DZ06 TaxID=3425126 RepID=UPI003D32AFBA
MTRDLPDPAAPTRLSAPWLRAPAAQAVAAALAAGGARSWFVGGCVRNALLGAGATDIDMATDARPEDTMRLLSAAGLRAVPTGIEHGTVTAVHKGVGIEATTLRADVATDGRRAVVAFTDDIARDAARRDFTMNALYCTPEGDLVDPLGGLPDLRARRVRFIGDAQQRIREDFLRILRFFRFHAWFGDPGGGIDPEGLAACAAEAEGIERLSRERIGAEMKKLLAAPDPAPALCAMAACGALMRAAPGLEAQAIAPLVAAEQAAGVAPSWSRRAAAGMAAGRAATGAFPDGPGLGLAEAWRLSRAEARGLERIAECLSAAEPPAIAAWRHGAEPARDAALIAAAGAGALLTPAAAAALEAEIARGAAAAFPVTARDLIARGVEPGPALGAALNRLQAAWLAADFAPDKAALLASIPEGGAGEA